MSASDSFLPKHAKGGYICWTRMHMSQMVL